MKLEDLASKNNLGLAWRRITTAGNYQYKKYFRDIYYKYEIALDQNLDDLRSRLLGHSYTPSSPTRIYIPKSSGLHRPITLLALEDQVVLQAIANLFAKKLKEKRQKMEFKFVFSNILSRTKTSIFFLQDWRSSYASFQFKVADYFESGYQWFAKFDLASFYDTISYELLLSTVFPRSEENELRNLFLGWFKCWSSEEHLRRLSHGIPQGPVASDYLAEAFLLPIDMALSRNGCRYIRYVDDIRIFGKTEIDIRREVIFLERLCRTWGLIPQSSKFEIKKANSVSEILNILPSLNPGHLEPLDEHKKDTINGKVALKMLQKSLLGRPQRIVDKAKAKHVLFRAEKSSRILNYVLKLLPSHPEHIDAFCFYLSRYKINKKIIKLCKKLIRESPYDYVLGEAWHVLSRMDPMKHSPGLIRKAMNVAKNKTRSFNEKWGACHFLCACEKSSQNKYSNFMMFQDALLQALLIPVIPGSRFVSSDVLIQKLLRRSRIEVGLMLVEGFAKYSCKPEDFGVPIESLATQVVNVYAKLGISQATNLLIDPMAEIISRRYGTEISAPWRKFFGDKYIHALQILGQGDPVYDSGRSLWLQHQNSFNDALFMKLQELLRNKSQAGVVSILNKHAQKKSFGVLLDPQNAFSRQYPKVADAFRNVNSRRNKLPGSHPYDHITGDHNRYLTKKEQKGLYSGLKTAYFEISQSLKNLLP